MLFESNGRLLQQGRPHGMCCFRSIFIFVIVSSFFEVLGYFMNSMDTESTFDQDVVRHRTVATALEMPEILEQIFKYLADPPFKDLISAALVCRRWRDAAYHPSLWNRQTASIDLQPLDSVQLLPSLARRRIYQIKLYGLQTHMRDLLPSLPSLKRFHFIPARRLGYSDSVMTDKMLRGAFQQSHTALVSFGLYRCKKITDASVILLCSRLPNLESLSLSKCTQVTDAGLVAVAGGQLQRLSTLFVNNCAITDAGVAALAGLRPEVALGTPHLLVLNMSGCGITDTALLHVSVGLPKLEILFLFKCHQITDAGVNHLLNEGVPKFILVNGSNGITEDIYEKLDKLPKLS